MNLSAITHTMRALDPRRETRQERMLTYGIPPHMLDGLERYLVQRIKPGSFLQAVLRGDLVMASRLADPTNTERINCYVDYLTAECPEECWGSPEAVRAWLAGPDYPCYSCGDESTHEIQHAGGWLYVCDDPACVGEPEFWSWEEQAADDAGMRCRGEI